MATRPPVIGASPLLVQQRKVAKRKADSRRGSAASRGYDADWRRLRAALLQANPLCLFCEEAGIVEAATVADHIISIEDRPDLRLVWSNLRPLCKPCHDRRTARDQAFGGRGARWPDWLRPASVPLHIVCGPPASGKSTWVRERAGPDDLVLDLDVIASRLSGKGQHSWGSQWLDPALRERNELLGRLSRTPCSWPAAWLIVSEPKAERRQWWKDTLKPASITVMETDPAVCRARLRLDPERTDAIDGMGRAILRWWAAYERRVGDHQVVTRP
ncbi:MULTISPECIES: AAA family ATPase [unclassified Brevundimonas]|uniref:AAA family ATPase n=1 Tax=unclassified Brevundimonas TaxID=2622653 RepID=UPI0010767614|nr:MULTISPECIES: AAA family ATPase [unclassified Brevundimonas]QBX37232.1 HNH nuclease [Brevundimonas sp. MF30-B]